MPGKVVMDILFWKLSLSGERISNVYYHYGPIYYNYHVSLERSFSPLACNRRACRKHRSRRLTSVIIVILYVEWTRQRT